MDDHQQIPSPDGDDPQWSELTARYDLLQAAARLALEALLTAYKAGADGAFSPPAELMIRYRNLSAMRIATEQALLAHIEANVPPAPR